MTKKLNIVVLISGNGSNLQAIIDASERNAIACNIQAVISNKAHAHGLERARNANIPTHALIPKEYTSRQNFESALQKTIANYSTDLVVLAGFMYVLSGNFVHHYHGKIINIHPSLLPKYKGLHTYERALAAGDKEHGCSIHFVTEELDGGPIIAQTVVPIQNDDSIESLMQKVQEQEHILYPTVVGWFAEGRLKMEAHHAYFDEQVIPPEGLRGAWTTNS